MSLQEILQRADVWRGSRSPAIETIASGFAVLDRLFPGGGWPRSAITEISLAGEGVGELRLLLPMIARLSRGDRWIAFIAPPYIPFAPALAAAGVTLSRLLLVHPRSIIANRISDPTRETGGRERPEGWGEGNRIDSSRSSQENKFNRADLLWAIEASLRSGACAATLAWTEGAGLNELRRWQLAAEAGGTCGFLFQRRPMSDSPAALRLKLEPASDGALLVHILKRRGGWPIGPIRLEIDRVMAMSASVGSPA